MARNKAGVDFEGAQQIEQQQHRVWEEQQNAQRLMFEQQRQAQDRFYAEQHAEQERSSQQRMEQDRAYQRRTDEERSRNNNGGGWGNGSGDGGNGGGSNGGGSNGNGRMSPSDYLPGRVSSQFNFKAKPQHSYKPSEHHLETKEGVRQFNYGMAVEEITSKDGQFKISIGCGPQGAVFVKSAQNGKGEFITVSHETSHIAGNRHIHPDESDKSKSYYTKPVSNNWFGKDSIIGNVVDKGPKAKLRK